MSRKANPDLSFAAGLQGGILSQYAKTILSALLVLVLVSVPAWAGLGQPEASVTSDQLHMKSEHRVQQFQAYKVHGLANTEGAVVREYVSPEGTVFGITWHGRSTPDMNQLLGSYVNNFETATRDQTQIRQRRGITIKTNDFVYTNFCRMGVCSGSAYAPKLVPSNVSVEVIR
jgi:uncharacterized protein DUF2844